MPPPRTLSISDWPDAVREPSFTDMLLSFCGFAEAAAEEASGPREVPVFAGFISIKLFQLPQEGHFPIHFGSVLPQLLHSKKVFSFAIKRFCIIDGLVASSYTEI